jgi:hypothetical protein
LGGDISLLSMAEQYELVILANSMQRPLQTIIEPIPDTEEKAKNLLLSLEVLCQLNTPRRYCNFACLSKTN